MPQIVLLAHNIRSAHNVGALFRTAEGFGVQRIIFSGYTPYPTLPGDTRLPHISSALTKKIHKTALGAEALVPFTFYEQPPLEDLKREGFTIIGLEQDERSVQLTDFQAPEKLALLIGEEVHGVEQPLRAVCDALIEIPMLGKKESFNVSVATGIALYGLQFGR